MKFHSSAQNLVTGIFYNFFEIYNFCAFANSLLTRTVRLCRPLTLRKVAFLPYLTLHKGN